MVFSQHGMNTDEKQKGFSLHTREIMGYGIITTGQHQAAMGYLNDPLLRVVLVIDKVLCSSGSPGCADQRRLHPKS